MEVNQAIVVTDKDHPKFDKGGIVLFVTPKPKATDFQPDAVVGFVDGEQFFLNEDQIKES